MGYTKNITKGDCVAKYGMYTAILDSYAKCCEIERPERTSTPQQLIDASLTRLIKDNKIDDYRIVYPDTNEEEEEEDEEEDDEEGFG